MTHIQARLFFILSILFVSTSFSVYALPLSCTVTTSAACTGTVILRMSGSTNAHAELPSQSNAAYANNVICCTGPMGLSSSCGGAQATVLKLYDVTNSHVQQSTQSGYTNNACISVLVGGSVTIGYQATNCTGYDTTLASMQAADNSHIGDTTAYTTKICGTAVEAPQNITFSISTNTAFFGAPLPTSSRFASSTNPNGDSQEVEAHTISVSTNAANGYNLAVQGQTLTAGSYVIAPIGNSNTAPAIGTEQFGLRMATTTGAGSISVPYSGSGFAYAATATTSSQVASGPGDGLTTTYSVRYVANVAGISKAGSYTANIVYVATANF